MRVVASAMTKGTFTSLAKVLASRVFPARDKSSVRIPWVVLPVYELAIIDWSK